MIWRDQNNGPDEEDRPEPREEPPSLVQPPVNSSPAINGVGPRVEMVLEAAERAAAEIRRDAERWAQRHMEETRRRADELAAQRVLELSYITDDLLARAQAVAQQSDDLISALTNASRQAAGTPRRRREDMLSTPERADRPANPEPSRPATASAEADGAPKSESERPSSPPVSPGARLLVTQMAIAGSSRETIASRLREEFRIEDPSAILDEAGL